MRSGSLRARLAAALSAVLSRHGNREVPRKPGRFAPGRGGLGPAWKAGSPPWPARSAPSRGGLGPAWGAEVVSSNIVGYEKITLNPGLNMIGNQFLAVGGTAFQNINQMFKDSSEITAGADDGAADSILRWTGNGYGEIYYYDDLDMAWESLDSPGVVSETTFSQGEGVWYKCAATAPIDTVLAGEVPTNAVYSVEIKAGLNFVANPYPMSICPNSASFSVDGVVAGADDGEADSILKWTGNGYGEIYYYDDLDMAWESLDNPGVAIDANILEPAEGFWYKHQGNGATLTFGKPY